MKQYKTEFTGLVDQFEKSEQIRAEQKDAISVLKSELLKWKKKAKKRAQKESRSRSKSKSKRKRSTSKS